MNHFKKRQAGAALFICLMLLTVMTILGISAVSTTTMEEKMAGNIRNKHMSFQAAEAALRAGETVANGLASDTVFDSTNGLYPQSKYGDDPADTGVYAFYPIWEDAVTTINWQNITTLGSLVSTAPSYIIEDFGTAPRDNDCMLDAEIPAGCLLPVYRITAQGYGTNDNAKSILQTTFKQL